MASLYDQRARVALELLRAAAGRPVGFEELKAAGVEDPGQTIYELELAGHVIEHSWRAVRLVGEPPAPRARRRRGLRRA